MDFNAHYKKRYDKFINSISLLENRKIDGYSETHHIIPRCMGGGDEKTNLIRLTLREHYIAHWLLYKAYNNNLSIVSAFYQMCNKNVKLAHKKFQRTINSRSYELLKSHFYKLNSEQFRGWVFAQNSKGEKEKITSEEYKLRTDLSFHTKGKVYCVHKVTKQPCYISTEEYKTGNYEIPNRPNRMGWNSSGSFKIKDRLLNIVINVTYNEWITKYKDVVYTKDNKFAKNKRYCFLKDFSNKDYSYKKDNFVVKNILTNKNEVIHRSNYNPSIHHTSTRNKIIVKDKDNNILLVDYEEYKKGAYDPVSKNYTTVLDKETNKYVVISVDVFNKNKNRYSGPCTGKVNVIDKITGYRKQINKQEFDSNKNRYLSLGSSKYYFLCKNVLTNKSKQINIYEWRHVKEKYQIIDLEKFEKLSLLIKD